MAKIVQISDFKGDYAITLNSYSGTHLQYFLDKYELFYLRKILGVELGEALYNDIATPFALPTATKYKTIFNPLNYDDNGLQICSEGLISILTGFIFFEYVRFQNIQNTITGNVKAQNEVSEVASFGLSSLYQNHNAAIKSAKSIQYYINDNISDYSNFNGICLEYTSQFI